MDYADLLKTIDEVSDVKLFVQLNSSDGAYVKTSKTSLKETLKKSKWFLDGYGSIDAHVKGKTLFVG